MTNIIPATTSTEIGKRQVDVEGFLRLLHPDGQVFEIRVIDCPDRKGGSFKSTSSGYFNDPKAAAKAIETIEKLEPPAVFVTINPAKSELLARRCNRIESKAKNTTGDADILRRQFLFIDIDPIRPAGLSSTESEMNSALEVASHIARYLTANDWPEPITGMSGNGAYILAKIDLPNTSEALTLITDCLEALSYLFGSDTIDIDGTAANAARIVKVLGTMARKGDSLQGVPGIEDRPHRQSWYTTPEKLEAVPTELLRLLAGKKPIPEPKQKTQFTGNSDFDLPRWLAEHNVPVGSPRPYDGGTKWIFEEHLPPCCDCSPSGHGPDGSGFIIQRSDGTIQAGCMHNRCDWWKWQDLRQAYEPGCYDRKDYSDVNIGHIANPQNSNPSPSVAAQSNSPKQSSEITPSTVTTPARTLLRHYIDKMHRGEFQKLLSLGPALDGLEIAPKQICIFGAPPGLGKTALAMQIAFESMEIDQSIEVVVANAETDFDGLIRRELSRMTRIPSKSIRFGELTAEDRYSIAKATTELDQRLGRMSWLNPPMGIEQLLNLKDKKPGLLIVDYVQKFAPSRGDTKQGITEVMGRLRELAMHGWAIIALSATARTVGKGGSTHESEKLTQASFRDSSELEYNADAAYLLVDLGEHDGKPYIRRIDLRCVKNRHDERVDKQLIFHMPRMSFEAVPVPINEDFAAWDGSQNPFDTEAA